MYVICMYVCMYIHTHIYIYNPCICLCSRVCVCECACVCMPGSFYSKTKVIVEELLKSYANLCILRCRLPPHATPKRYTTHSNLHWGSVPGLACMEAPPSASTQHVAHSTC